MASLTKQHDWYYLEFYNARRKPKRKRVSLKTQVKRTAETLKRKLEDLHALGRYDPWVDLHWEQPKASELAVLGAAYEAFMETKRGCRKATRDHYRWVLSPFKDFLGEDFPVRRLTWKEVLAWLDATGGNAQSRQTYLSRIGIFVRWLKGQGAMGRDITKEVPLERPPDKLALKLITDDHLKRILEVARGSRAPYIADVAVIAFDLALRLGEVCAMRCGWVDLERKRLVVQTAGSFRTKSGKEVSKPISGRAHEVLTRLVREKGCPDAHVFLNTKGRPLEPKHTSKTFKKIIRRAGLPETLTFHGLRHGGLSKVIANGGSVEAARRFAGHTKIDMTMRYAHLLDEQYDQQVLRAMDR